MEKITLEGQYREDFEKVSGEPLNDQLPGMLTAMVLAGQESQHGDHDWYAYEFSTSDVDDAYPKLTVDCDCGVKFQVVY